MRKLTELIEKYIADEKLPNAYLDVALKWFTPLCDSINLHQNKSREIRDASPTPFFIGINGCQGSGKSTLSGLMNYLFKEYYGKQSVVLSLDDFYYTKLERTNLAQTVHPLLLTRGVPGTHDTELMARVIASLANGEAVNIPNFDKSIDDRAPVDMWQQIKGPIDIVIIEGWCWGTRAQDNADLAVPVNALEKNGDSDGAWRSYVNNALSTKYTPLYHYIDTWVFLKAPSFDAVYAWRRQQEKKLALRVGNASHIMSDEEILSFIQYYQRLTVHTLLTLEKYADFIFELDNERNITKSRYHAK